MSYGIFDMFIANIFNGRSKLSQNSVAQLAVTAAKMTFGIGMALYLLYRNKEKSVFDNGQGKF